MKIGLGLTFYEKLLLLRNINMPSYNINFNKYTNDY